MGLAALVAAALISWAIQFGLVYFDLLRMEQELSVTFFEFRLMGCKPPPQIDLVRESAKGAAVMVMPVLIGLLLGIPLRFKGWRGIVGVFLASLASGELLHFWAYGEWDAFWVPTYAGIATGIALGDLPARGKPALIRLACCGGFAIGAFLVQKTVLSLIEFRHGAGPSPMNWLTMVVFAIPRSIGPWLPFVFAWLLVPALPGDPQVPAEATIPSPES